MTGLAPRLRRWAPVVAWMGVIFLSSSMPGSSVPGDLSVLGHLSAYAVLGALAYRASAPRGSEALAVAVVVASLYGVTDELHQWFVPARVPSMADWALDTLGACAGALLAHAAVGAGRQ